MTSQLPLAEGRHDHPPICCCGDEGDKLGSCPACPDHGVLASSSNPVECPQCHAPIGRPHTDYCTLAPGRVWDGVLPVAPLVECAYPHLNHGDGRGCDHDDCPRHGGR